MRLYARTRRRRRRPAVAPTMQPAGVLRRQVQAVLGHRVQPALRVGSPDTASEREADRMADQVTRVAPSGEAEMVWRQADEEEKSAPETETAAESSQETVEDTAGETSPEKEKPEEEVPVQASGAKGGEVADSVAQAIRGRRGGGRPLPPAARRFFESRFGTGFAGVRVHADETAARLASAIGARAFTYGQDIFFGTGEFAPDRPAGRHLLAHELTHVLQQRSGQPLLQRRVVPRRVSCHGYPANHPVLQAIGQASGNEAVAEIQQAANHAVRLLGDAIAVLVSTRNRIRQGEPAARPTVSDALARALQRRLRLNPHDRQVWIGSGPGTVEMAIRWYRNVRRILAGDWMRYNCLGPDCNNRFSAWTNVGEYRIRLCRSFWQSSVDARAVTLIHEASHIYYGTEDRGRGLGSAYCMEQFICDLNGFTNVCLGCGGR